MHLPTRSIQIDVNRLHILRIHRVPPDSENRDAHQYLAKPGGSVDKEASMGVSTGRDG
jgi:hypothetical protein